MSEAQGQSKKDDKVIENKYLYHHSLAKFVVCNNSPYIPYSNVSKVENQKAQREISDLKTKIDKYRIAGDNVASKRSDTTVCTRTYPTSIVFWPNSTKPIKGKERELYTEEKMYSHPEHASTSMQKAMIFHSGTVHSSVPCKKGWRVAMQLQFTPNKFGMYLANKYPECIPAAIRINEVGETDPLVMLLKYNIEELLEKVINQTNRKVAFAHKNGKGCHYVDIKVPQNFPKRNGIEFSQNGKEAFLQSLEWEYKFRDTKVKASDTLHQLMLEKFCLSSGAHTDLTDLRLVFVSGASIFNIHDDTGHIETSDKAITLHLNIVHSSDYVPGDQTMGPWILDDKNIADKMRQQHLSLIKLKLWRCKFGMAEGLYNCQKKKFNTTKENRGLKRMGKGRNIEEEDAEDNMNVKKKSKNDGRKKKPEKPSRPLTMFIAYNQLYRKKIGEENPNADFKTLVSQKIKSYL